MEKNVERWHVSVMYKDGTYKDKTFRSEAEANMELCYARGDDYRDSVKGLAIWKEFRCVKSNSDN